MDLKVDTKGPGKLTLALLLGAMASMRRANCPPCHCCGCYHFKHSGLHLLELFQDQQFMVCYASRGDAKDFCKTFTLMGIKFIQTD
jgi:hypothetical protein